MSLLKFEGYKVVIQPELLSIKPFRKIWERDKSEDKNKAIQEISYIYFFCDSKSEYQYLVNEDDRKQAIMEGEGFPQKWSPDKTMEEAMVIYSSFKTAAALLLEDTRVLVDKLRYQLRTIDLDNRDDKGKPIYTLNTVTSTIKQIPELIKNLSDAERLITTNYKESSKMRGEGEKTILEDDLNI